jgi:outer membrane protein TolC
MNADGGTSFIGRPGGAPDAVTPVLRSVSFREAWETALARNPTVTSALQEIRRVSGLMEEVRAASLPTLGVNATYTRLNKDRTFVADPDAGPIVVQGKDSINVTGTLAIPILAPQAWANWKRAADQIENSKLSQRDFQRQVAVNVARAYLAVFAQKRQVDVNIQARDNSKAHLLYADQRLKGGIGNRIDWARAGEDLESNEAILQNSYANLYRTQEALGVLLGVEGPVDTQNIPQLVGLPSLDEALAETPTRADLLLFNQEQTAADRSLNMSWTEYMPNITLYGQPIFQSPASLTTPKTSWQIQAVLTWRSTTGGHGRTHERQAQLEQVKIRWTRNPAGQPEVGLDRQLRPERRAVQRARCWLAGSDATGGHPYRAGSTANPVIDAQRRRDAEPWQSSGGQCAPGSADLSLRAASRPPPGDSAFDPVSGSGVKAP